MVYILGKHFFPWGILKTRQEYKIDYWLLHLIWFVFRVFEGFKECAKAIKFAVETVSKVYQTKALLMSSSYKQHTTGLDTIH